MTPNLAPGCFAPTAPLPTVPMRDPAEVDWISVETKTPQPYPAVIPAADLAALRADLATVQAQATRWQAEAARWRQKVMDTRELIALVEDLADNPSPAAAIAVINHFQMWRTCVEAGVPVTWAQAAPVLGVCIDEWEAARTGAEDTEPPF